MKQPTEKGTLPFFLQSSQDYRFTRKRGVSPFRVRVAAIVVLAGATLASASDTVKLKVDLTSAAQHIFHATMRIPAKPGALTLLYPKWIPGEHGPTGPIKDVAGIVVKANGKDIGFKRDPKEPFAIAVNVPAGASEIEVSLDLLTPPDTERFSAGKSSTSKLAVLSWNQLVMYPATARGNAINYEASVTFPPGWKFATALPVRSERLPEVTFEPVTLTTLLDSPVLSGEFMKTVVLDDRSGRRVVLDMAAEAPPELEVPPELETGFKNLVKEADAMFGARHFAAYHFLLTLSEGVPHFGLEHHQSSDDRVRERSFLDPDKTMAMLGLLPHEYVHSWNGKFRRPAGEPPDDYLTTNDTNLIWVYEGLTSYLGWVLSARSGLRSVAADLDNLAMTTAELDTRAGRSWRSLDDTATTAALLYETGEAWGAWRRRSRDFYNEGTLIWLDTDVAIRKLTKGARSLDDFCKRFHGGGTGLAEVKTYTIADIVADLNAVAPNDWAGFLKERLERRTAGAPMGGIDGGGWRLTYADTRSPLEKNEESMNETVDVRYSLGLLLNKAAKIIDVLPSSKAWAGGLTPGMTVVAVNGRRYSKEVLHDAILATKTAPATVKLLMESDEFFREVSVEVSGGERYPVLTRATGGDDVLGAILAPKAESPYNSPPATTKR